MTWYSFLLFVHVAMAVIWVGGGLMMQFFVILAALIPITALGLKKAGGWGWYGRSSSKVSCDAQLVDNKSGAVVVSISVVAKTKFSSVEEALADAATQIADYLREKK